MDLKESAKGFYENPVSHKLMSLEKVVTAELIAMEYYRLILS